MNKILQYTINPVWNLIRNHYAKILSIYISIVLILMFVWSSEPDGFDPVQYAKIKYDSRDHADVLLSNIKMPTGYVTVNTDIALINYLLNKPGGYISNDRFPPGILMDNILEFEYGVLTAIRDHQIWLRNSLSRSQSQSTENKNLEQSNPAIMYDNNSWMLPTSEGQYHKSLKYTDRYLEELADYNESSGNFYARADNLALYLDTVSNRLGSLSQRLAQSKERDTISTNVDINNSKNVDEKGATSAKSESLVVRRKTPWLKIDNVLYEARGYSYALLHIMKSTKYDFATVLQKKAAVATIDNIINELEGTQTTIMWPVVLNGNGMGLMSNHSAFVSSYVSRANAAVLNMIELLNNG